MEVNPFFTTLALFLVTLSILLYIINAISLSRIASGRGSDKGWLAWIPIANGFVIPLLVEDDVLDSLRGRFTLLYGVVLILCLIPFVGFIFSLVSVIMIYYGFHVLVEQYSRNAMSHLVISILTLGMSMPFSLFIIRNRERLV